MKEWITKVFVMGFCMVAVADTTYEPENDGRTLVVTVPSGETNVFDYVNYKDALTGNVYTNVVKRGTGCLDMKDSIEAFTGDFAVESGTLRYWSQFALGWTNINCTVTVNDGATLAVHGDQSYPKFNLGGKTFVVEGFGVNGVGAIYNGGVSQSDKYPMAIRIKLLGDTRFGAYRRLDFVGKTIIDMGGNSIYVNTVSKDSPITFLGGLAVENPGNIHVERGALMMYGGVNWPYQDGNCINLGEGTYLMMSECARSAMPWSIFCSSSSALTFTGGGTWVHTGLMTNRNFITGTIHTGDNLVNMTTYANRNGLGVTLAGKVTGPGGLYLAGGDPEMTDVALDPHLSLVNSENDFQSGVVVKHGTLHLYAPMALPPNGGSLVVTNGSVKFESSGFYRMPDFAAHGNCTVENTPACDRMGASTSVTNSLGSSTVGKWKDICKTGDGNLTFSTAVSGKSLCVKKGGVVIDCGQVFGGTNFAAIAGLIEGCNTTYTPGDAQNDFVNMTAFTNRVQLSPTLAYYNGAYGDKAPVDKSNYYTYSGYIWNRASTNVNWTFALAIGTVSRITIDQKTTYIGNGATGEVGIKTFELTPGPHRIVIAMRSNSDARSTARYFTNEKATWPKSYFGVGIDKSGRGSNNQADYEKLVDPGDGSLLTWALPEDLPCVYPGTDEIVESIVPVRFDEMEFHPETTIDFVDLPDYSVENLMGTPNVAGSSNLTVTGVWTILASSIAAGAKLTTSGRLIFAEGSKIVISGSSSEFRKVTADVALIVAETSEGVTGTPSVETDCTDGADLARWRISVSDRCISAVRSPYGLKIMVR